MSELEQLGDGEALATWAQRVLPLKNQLSTPDCHVLEAGFAARLHEIGEGEMVRTEEPESEWTCARARRTEPGDQAVIVSKPVREHDRNHLRFVARRPCLVCGRSPCDPHHIKFAEQRAMGRKVSDRFTVPICRLHHRELHRRGNEREWWQTHGIDPLAIAARLWAMTHAVAPADAEIVGDRDRSAGQHKAQRTSIRQWGSRR